MDVYIMLSCGSFFIAPILDYIFVHFFKQNLNELGTLNLLNDAMGYYKPFDSYHFILTSDLFEQNFDKLVFFGVFLVLLIVDVDVYLLGNDICQTNIYVDMVILPFVLVENSIGEVYESLGMAHFVSLVDLAFLKRLLYLCGGWKQTL